jgi:SNF2 family DNA or RNA helicase
MASQDIIDLTDDVDIITLSEEAEYLNYSFRDLIEPEESSSEVLVPPERAEEGSSSSAYYSETITEDISLPNNEVYNTLSDFQKEILWEAYDKENGALALVMGTGKTFISIQLALMLRMAGPLPYSPILVIASKTLIGTWIQEIHKFFGDTLDYKILHQEYVKLDEFELPKDLVLTTPEVVSSTYKECNIAAKFTYLDFPDRFAPAVRRYNRPDKPYELSKVGARKLYAIKWSVLMIDESQCYYNIGCDRTLAMASICAHNRWLLSGTLLPEPKPHKILGYYLLLNDKNAPRNLPDIRTLIRDRKFKGLGTTAVVREVNEDFSYQVTVNSTIVSHTLTQEEATVYTSIKAILFDIRDKLKKYKREEDKENIKKFSSYAIAMMSYLRECLVAPLIAVTTVAIKTSDLNSKSYIADIFMKNLRTLGLEKWLDNEESVCSSRIKSVLNTLEKHSEDKILVFSCFRTVVDLLMYFIPNDRECFSLDSNHSAERRNEVIGQFNDTDNGILLMTYNLGCNGLNLQEANTVIILDFWWNVSTTMQAISRTLRRGQKSSVVNAYYFTANTGIENNLFDLHRNKAKISSEVFSGFVRTKPIKMTSERIIRMVETNDNITILNENIK